MKKTERYSHILSIILNIMALLCALWTIKHIWFGEEFALSMVFAICLGVIAGGRKIVKEKNKQ